MPEAQYLIPGLEPYITLRIVSLDDGNDNVEISMESGNGFTQETALEFLKEFVKNSEEA